MHCFDGLAATLKDKINRIFRFPRSQTKPSGGNPLTLQRQHIGLPRNVRKEEDPYSSLLALAGTGADKSHLLQEKPRFSALHTHTITSHTSLPCRPLPRRSSSLAAQGYGGAKTHTAPPPTGSRDSSRTGISGRTAVAEIEEGGVRGYDAGSV